MSIKLKLITAVMVLLTIMSCKENKIKEEIKKEVENSDYYKEQFRPQFHFTPEQKWMNDPNGLVYHNGVYHLFYQYYPEDIVWGPMHWGHAVSKDMIYWEHKPIALYPDELGLIFSGSAVVDKDNTSGFGTLENPPLVAIFTYHDMEGEKSGKTDFQTQGIAYSLDNGDSWTKFSGNPVIGNDGIKDFRDPKVFWNDQANVWTMLLVAGDHLQIWNSANLKQWEKVSEFGKDKGAHGGVWECPDMFKLKVEGTNEEKWVLLISINPGAPNGGSGTQYFIGDFDGNKFATDQKESEWLDWGTDNYAGVTYNNVPNGDRIFIGWMSNWAYARDTPTEKWRSAMTLPRTISLRKIGDEYVLINYPIKEFNAIVKTNLKKEIVLEPGALEELRYDHFNQAEVTFKTTSKAFRMKLKNSLDENLVLNFDAENQLILLDRTQSGKIDFQEDFGNHIQQMPIDNLPDTEFEVRIILDHSSIEIFINKGQYVMTAQLFPNEQYNMLMIENTSAGPLRLKDFGISKVTRIWED
ncbi:MAG: glycoside hydrolase family 32 protein [Maribacter sp.]